MLLYCSHLHFFAFRHFYTSFLPVHFLLPLKSFSIKFHGYCEASSCTLCMPSYTYHDITFVPWYFEAFITLVLYLHCCRYSSLNQKVLSGYPLHILRCLLTVMGGYNGTLTVNSTSATVHTLDSLATVMLTALIMADTFVGIDSIHPRFPEFWKPHLTLHILVETLLSSLKLGMKIVFCILVMIT